MMQSCEDALSTFLALPTTRETVAQLTSVIPFDSLCKALVTDDVSVAFREDLSTALRRALHVQSVCTQYCLHPFNLAILASSKLASSEEGEGAERFLCFLEELAQVTEGDIHKCLSAALGPMVQLISCLSLTEVPVDLQPIAMRVVTKLLLPLLDAERVGSAEMAKQTIEATVDGRMLHVFPQAADLDARILPPGDHQNFDAQVLRWQGHQLLPNEKDRLCRWLSEASLIDALLERLTGTAHLTAGKSSASIDVVRVRAASLLVFLIEACPAFEQRARAEGWIKKIIVTLYQTDDILLRMSAAELVVTEILQCPAAVDHLWEENLCEIFLSDLKSEDVDNSLRWGLVRLLSNLVERIPKSREMILMKDKTLIKTLASHFERLDDFTFRPNALSAIGSVASALNPIGVQALFADFPEWVQEYERVLTSGSEAEILAALTGLIRIAGGVCEGGSVSGGKVGRDQRGLKALENELSAAIVCQTLTKPFAACRELVYKAFTALLMLGVTSPLSILDSRADLQKAVFAPVYEDPPNVCYAKHEFVQKALAMFADWIKSNCTDTTFTKAMEFFNLGGPFSIPPHYKGQDVDVEERTAA